MEDDKASGTAALTAMLRAAHQLVDDEPKIVNDPIAVRLVDGATRKFILARSTELHSPALTIPRAAVCCAAVTPKICWPGPSRRA
jgi:O-methyltransferase involved in polyketide biosynthesis